MPGFRAARMKALRARAIVAERELLEDDHPPRGPGKRFPGRQAHHARSHNESSIEARISSPVIPHRAKPQQNAAHVTWPSATTQSRASARV